MKRLLIFIIGILLLRTAAFGQRTIDSLAQYHPLQNGNKWVYRTIRPPISGFQTADTFFVTREIVKDTLINGLRFRIVIETGGFFSGRYAERFDSVTGNFYSGSKLYDSTMLNSRNTYFDVFKMIYEGSQSNIILGIPITERHLRANSVGAQQAWIYGFGIGLVSYRFSDILPDRAEYKTLVYAKIGGKEYGSILSVEQKKEIPHQYHLDQNFPNPFNPSTTISFSLPSRSFVSLKIFDVMGREITTVVNEDLVPGVYSKQWNATGFPSGVYFYRLRTGTYTETKRLILLR